MKIWVDNIRPAPHGYIECRSVNEARDTILMLELYATVNEAYRVELINIDHDAGDFSSNGGDFIKLLDWLEETGRNYPIHMQRSKDTYCFSTNNYRRFDGYPPCRKRLLQRLSRKKES